MGGDFGCCVIKITEGVRHLVPRHGHADEDRPLVSPGLLNDRSHVVLDDELGHVDQDRAIGGDGEGSSAEPGGELVVVDSLGVELWGHAVTTSEGAGGSTRRNHVHMELVALPLAWC